MANYSLTTYTVTDYSQSVAAAGMETFAETIDTTKTIYTYSLVYNAKTGQFCGTVVVAT